MDPVSKVIRDLQRAAQVGLPDPFVDPADLLLHLGSELSYVIEERDEQVTELLAHPDFPGIERRWRERYGIELGTEVEGW